LSRAEKTLISMVERDLSSEKHRLFYLLSYHNNYGKEYNFCSEVLKYNIIRTDQYSRIEEKKRIFQYFNISILNVKRRATVV